MDDQDLRVVAPVLRSSEPGSAAQVAVAVSHVLVRLGQLLHPTEKVSLREILPGVAKILPRHAEVVSGGMVAVAMVVVVAMVLVVAMVVVVAMVMAVVVVAEQIAQETSHETSRETCETEHSFLSSSLGVPAPASCRRSGAY